MKAHDALSGSIISLGRQMRGSSTTSTSSFYRIFIVDNSLSGWAGLRYLEEWAGIAKSFDVATGYFEIGSLLALDGKWLHLYKIRILMGDIRAKVEKHIKNGYLKRIDAPIGVKPSLKCWMELSDGR